MPTLPDIEKSFWRESYETTIYPELTGDIEIDLVVIGAGITGLTSAYLAKSSGLTVAVVEKDTVGGGTTGRTTGKVTSQHGITYQDLYTRLGSDTARVYGEANEAAIERIQSIIKKERIDCDWQREDNYVFTADSSQVEKFRQEADVAARLGLPATFETSTSLPFEIKGAVKFANQATFNSQKYLLGLAKAVHGSGSFVFENSNVFSIKDEEPCRIKTKKGQVIAKNIIVATNVPTLPLAARGGYCMLEYPTESYLVAGRPQVRIDGMYISPDKQHYSILPTKVDGESFILIGGEGGNLPGFRFSKEARYKYLASYAEKYFGVTDITNKWSDRDYVAYDSIPLIGRMYPWSKHLYVGSAYRKWGLSNGTVAGMILSDIVLGKENAWASYFNPLRARAVKSFPRAVIQHIKS